MTGYDMPVVASIMNGRARMALGYGWPMHEIQAKLRAGVAKSIQHLELNRAWADELGPMNWGPCIGRTVLIASFVRTSVSCKAISYRLFSLKELRQPLLVPELL